MFRGRLGKGFGGGMGGFRSGKKEIMDMVGEGCGG